MKTASAELAALLGAGPFAAHDLWTVTLADGTILRWTSCGRNLIVGGQTYLAASQTSPSVERGDVEEASGLEISTLDVTLRVTPLVLYAGIPFALAAANGLFYRARLQLDQLFQGYAGDVSIAPLAKLFEGQVAQCVASATRVKLTVKNVLDEVNIPIPRRIIQPQCAYALFDPGCGLSAAAFTVPATVSAVTDKKTFSVSLASSPASGYYALGLAHFTSGPDVGAMATIASATQVDGTHQALVLQLPLRVLPVVGDALNVRPGCDLLLSTCTTKFSNATRFGGFPSVPPPNSVI